jgi:hypothetical protein
VKRIVSGLLNSFVAAIAGWFAGILVGILLGLGEAFAFHDHDFRSVVIGDAWIVAFSSPFLIVPVWLFVLLPLYWFASSSSRLWRLPVCTVMGGLAGVILLAALRFSTPSDLHEPAWSWYTLAVITGGTTCLVGSLIHERSRDFHARI